MTRDEGKLLGVPRYVFFIAGFIAVFLYLTVQSTSQDSAVSISDQKASEAPSHLAQVERELEEIKNSISRLQDLPDQLHAFVREMEMLEHKRVYELSKLLSETMENQHAAIAVLKEAHDFFQSQNHGRTPEVHIPEVDETAFSPPPPQAEFLVNVEHQCIGEHMEAGPASGVRNPMRRNYKPDTKAANVARTLFEPRTLVSTYGPEEHPSALLLTTGVSSVYKMTVINALSSHFKNTNQRMAFLDVGCHVGVLGLIAYRHGHDVFFMDPLAQNLDRVCESLQLNDVEANDDDDDDDDDDDEVQAQPRGRAVVFPVTLWKADSNELYASPDPLNMATSRLTDVISDNAEFPSQRVQAVALDDVFPKLDIRSSTKVVISLNVQGFEMDAWKGGKKTFKQSNVVAVLFENWWAGSEASIQKWLSGIEKMGLELYCCNGCEDEATDGRCRHINTNSGSDILGHAKNLIAMRPEYFSLISHYVCTDDGKCSEGKKE